MPILLSVYTYRNAAPAQALTRRFDRCELNRFAVGPDEFAAAEARLDAATKRAIDEARAGQYPLKGQAPYFPG